MARLIFLDTETTGLDLRRDRLCQICYREGEELFESLFKPPVPISIKATSIHHITNKAVQNLEEFKGSRLWVDLKERLESGILVAHNAPFDIAMLEAEGLKVDRHICTYRLAIHMDPKGLIPEYNLQFLRYFLGLDVPGQAHDAAGDVAVLFLLFSRLSGKLAEQLNFNKEEILSEMIRISESPIIFPRFLFGKYRGKRIHEIAETDRPYLEWLLERMKSHIEPDWNWIATLEAHLGRSNMKIGD